MKTVACAQCGALLKPYWLKNGVCGGCRYPHLVVKAQVAEVVFVMLHHHKHGVDTAVFKTMDRALTEQQVIESLDDFSDEHNQIEIVECEVRR